MSGSTAWNSFLACFSLRLTPAGFFDFACCNSVCARRRFFSTCLLPFAGVLVFTSSLWHVRPAIPVNGSLEHPRTLSQLLTVHGCWPSSQMRAACWHPVFGSQVSTVHWSRSLQSSGASCVHL